MRRLVHLLSGLEIGGKERVVLDLARRARADGLEPLLVLFDTPFRDSAVDFDPGDLPWEFLPRRPGVDWRFPLALARRLRAWGADVVHAHNDTAVFYACAAARTMGRSGPAVCATFHTRPGHSTRAARTATRWAAGRADAITAVSDELAAVVVADGWVRRCDTLWNGVDLEHFTPKGPGGGWREDLGVPAGSILVGHIARFDPIKRHEDLLAAADELADGPSPAVVVLVGQGPAEERIRALAAGRENVRVVPRVADVAAFLRELDVFALCSDHEAAPRVLLEAMACGRAIVATAVGGVPAILDGGAGAPVGELVPARDAGRLAAAIRALGRDPDRRRALGERARARAEAFSADREWGRYRDLYRSAWARRRPRHGRVAGSYGDR